MAGFARGMGQDHGERDEQLCALKSGHAPTFLYGLFRQLVDAGALDPISRVTYVPDGVNPVAWVIRSLLRCTDVMPTTLSSALGLPGDATFTEGAHQWMANRDLRIDDLPVL